MAPRKKPVTKKKATAKKKRKASLIDGRIGNEFWKKRIKHGRDKIFATPEMLWDCCMEYFKWVEDNPLMEVQVKTPSGKVEKVDVPKMRAMTIGGLCLFLGVGTSTWDDYATREDFSGICKDIDEVMRTQKFAGAAAGFLNHAIIARHLGLVDKKEVTGKDGGPIRTINTEMSAEQAAEVYNEMME